MVAGSDDGAVALFRWKGDGTLEQEQALLEHDDAVLALAAQPAKGRVLSASADGRCVCG